MNSSTRLMVDRLAICQSSECWLICADIAGRSLATGGEGMREANRQRAVLHVGNRRWRGAAGAPGRPGGSREPAATRGCLRAAVLMPPAAGSGHCAARELRTGRHRAKRASRQLLDVAQIGPLLIAAERDRDPRGAGPRGSADTMHVIFGYVRQLEIDDVRHPSTSMPRAAMSVATSTRVWPSRKPASARSRCGWDLLP